MIYTIRLKRKERGAKWWLMSNFTTKKLTKATEFVKEYNNNIWKAELVKVTEKKWKTFQNNNCGKF